MAKNIDYICHFSQVLIEVWFKPHRSFSMKKPLHIPAA